LDHFETLAVNQALQLRLIAQKLVKAVKLWKSKRQRATATFYVNDNLKTEEVTCLYKSNNFSKKLSDI
jgi:hypothetical protein